MMMLRRPLILLVFVLVAWPVVANCFPTIGINKIWRRNSNSDEKSPSYSPAPTKSSSGEMMSLIIKPLLQSTMLMASRALKNYLFDRAIEWATDNIRLTDDGRLKMPGITEFGGLGSTSEPPHGFLTHFIDGSSAHQSTVPREWFSISPADLQQLQVQQQPQQPQQQQAQSSLINVALSSIANHRPESGNQNQNKNPQRHIHRSTHRLPPQRLHLHQQHQQQQEQNKQQVDRQQFDGPQQHPNHQHHQQHSNLIEHHQVPQQLIDRPTIVVQHTIVDPMPTAAGQQPLFGQPIIQPITQPWLGPSQWLEYSRSHVIAKRSASSSDLKKKKKKDKVKKLKLKKYKKKKKYVLVTEKPEEKTEEKHNNKDEEQQEEGSSSAKKNFKTIQLIDSTKLLANPDRGVDPGLGRFLDRVMAWHEKSD